MLSPTVLILVCIKLLKRQTINLMLSKSQRHSLVFPAASRPNIRILISLLPNIFDNSLPIVCASICMCMCVCMCECLRMSAWELNQKNAGYGTPPNGRWGNFLMRKKKRELIIIKLTFKEFIAIGGKCCIELDLLSSASARKKVQDFEICFYSQQEFH